MKIGAPGETASGERRVALAPETVARLVKAGHQIVIQAGAGSESSYPDDAYRNAGAEMVSGADAVPGVVGGYARAQTEGGQARQAGCDAGV